jgi:hypothetical protein
MTTGWSAYPRAGDLGPVNVVPRSAYFGMTPTEWATLASWRDVAGLLRGGYTPTARAGGYAPSRGAAGALTSPDYRMAYLAARPTFEPYSMESYYETQASPIWEKYLVEAKRRWEEEEAPKLRATLSYPGTSALAQAFLGSPLQKRLEEGPSEAELVGGFKGYLEKYPWWEEWIKIPKRERGEYPARFRPPTRFLSY